MGDFFAELRRRHIYRLGAAYVVVAWGITQVLDVLSQLFALPDWIAQPAVIVLAIGLPVTLIAAWVIVGAANETDSSAHRLKATATDWVLASALVAVLGFLVYERLNPATSEVALPAETESTAPVSADEIVEDVADRMPNSVAVLPFENLSLDPENAFFASGVHGEIINQLSKLRNLSVIARTSVIDYPESGKSVLEIADELNVEMIMGGSVRYAGDQVRVIVELFDGATNLPVWTDEYDGELSDIFGIQAEIAMNIANSLQAEFSVAEQENIHRLPTDSPAAYALFLKAMELYQQGVFGASDASRARRSAIHEFLDEALELDPEFALAYAWKAQAYTLSKVFDAVTEEDWLDFRLRFDRLASEYLVKALELNPDLGFAHAIQANEHIDNRRWQLAQREADLALQLSPNDSEVLALHSWIEFGVKRRPQEAIRYATRRTELDPNNDESHAALGTVLLLSGRPEEAIEAFEKCLTIDPLDAGCTRELAASEFALGNHEAALNTLGRLELGRNSSAIILASIAYGSGLLGQSQDAVQAFERMRELATAQYVDPAIWAWAYMGVGDYAEALNRLNSVAENPELVQIGFMRDLLSWNIWSDPMLETSEFLDVRNRLSPP